MICSRCVTSGLGQIDMEICRSFGREHHHACRTCGHTVICEDRLSLPDRERFEHDKSVMPQREPPKPKMPDFEDPNVASQL